MKKIPTILMIAALLSACAGGTAPRSLSDKTIRIKGSDTMVRLVQQWAAEYMKQHPGVAIYAEGGGTRTGIDALINGKIDICAASRTLQATEVKDLLEKRGSLGISVLCARDALSVYLNPGNPVRDLSLQQVRGIFTGRIRNWKDVGGLDEPIVVVSREPNSGTYLFFEEHVLLDSSYAPSARYLPGTEAITKEVAANRSAVGYGGLAYGRDVFHCRINGMEPSPGQVRSGAYPISRYLYLYVTEPPKGVIKSFVDWVLGPEGQAIVGRIGYVPLFEYPE